jgi:hypothetical protein
MSQLEIAASAISIIGSIVGAGFAVVPTIRRSRDTRYRLATVPIHQQSDEFRRLSPNDRTIELFQEIDPRYRAQAFKHLIDNDRTIENVLTHVDIYREVAFRYVVENQRTMDNLLLLNLSDENQVINFKFLRKDNLTPENFGRLSFQQRNMTNLLALFPVISAISENERSNFYRFFESLNNNQRTINNLLRFEIYDDRVRAFRYLTSRYLSFENLVNPILRFSPGDAGLNFKYLRDDQRTIENLLLLSADRIAVDQVSPQAVAFESLINQHQTMENLYLIPENDHWYCIKNIRDLHEAFVSSVSFASFGDFDSCEFLENFYRFLGYLRYDGNLQISLVERIPEEYSTIKLFSYFHLIESANPNDFVIENDFRSVFYLELSKKFNSDQIDNLTGTEHTAAIDSIVFLINSLFRHDTRISSRNEFLERISLCLTAKYLLHNKDRDNEGEFLLSFNSRLTIACNIESGKVGKDWLCEIENNKEKSKFDFLDTQERNQLERILCEKLAISEINGYWFLKYCSNDRFVQFILLDKMFQYCMMTDIRPALHKSILREFDHDRALQFELIKSMSINDNVSFFSPNHFTAWSMRNNPRLYFLILCIREQNLNERYFFNFSDSRFQLVAFLRLYFRPDRNPNLIRTIIDRLTYLNAIDFILSFNERSDQVSRDNLDIPELTNQRIDEETIRFLLTRRDILKDRYNRCLENQNRDLELSEARSLVEVADTDYEY